MRASYLGWLLAGLLPLGAAHGESYVVGVERLSFQPHYWVDEQGEYRGFAREVLDLFAQAEHIELSYRALPVTELAGRLVKGEVDLKYPDSPEWADDVKAGKPMAYSAPVVGYVDGVLVDPKRVGQGIDGLRRLALVQGWTPRGYQSRIDEGKVQPVQGSDLRQMIRQALKKQADGAYFNVVVATYYLDNIRARPGALVFDPSLPHPWHLPPLQLPAPGADAALRPLPGVAQGRSGRAQGALSRRGQPRYRVHGAGTVEGGLPGAAEAQGRACQTLTDERAAPFGGPCSAGSLRPARAVASCLVAETLNHRKTHPVHFPEWLSKKLGWNPYRKRGKHDG